MIPQCHRRSQTISIPEFVGGGYRNTERKSNKKSRKLERKTYYFEKNPTSGRMKLHQHDLWAARGAPANFPPTGMGKARQFLPESKDAFMAKDA